MSNNEQFYYNKWIEQVAENKKLKIEIERLNKIRDYNSNFKERMEFLERENKRYSLALKKLKFRLKRTTIEKDRYKQSLNSSQV